MDCEHHVLIHLGQLGRSARTASAGGRATLWYRCQDCGATINEHGDVELTFDQITNTQAIIRGEGF